jgi:hypothetical protein
LTICPTEDDGSSESAALKEFRDNPEAVVNFNRLIDLQYVKFLQISTNDEKLMIQGRVIMAVTTHIYFLYIFTEKDMKKKNPLLM